MSKFKRRFDKDEFKRELFAHLHDMPADHFRSKKKLEEAAAVKAEHYSQALAALDNAAARLRKLAEMHSDESTRQETEAAITEINDAINAYGEASLSGNSMWNNNSKHES